MSAKLKTLKVAELRDILANAAVSFPSKATKSDLIAKINASPVALQLFHASHPPPRTKTSPVSVAPQNDDLLAPPEDVDWNSDAVDTSPDVKVTPVKNPNHPNKASSSPLNSVNHVLIATQTVPATAPATQPSPNQPSAPQDDEETAKRKARAARFGVPLVEPLKQERPAKKAQAQSRNAGTPTHMTSSVDVPEMLAARALRFGRASPPPTAVQKRAAPVEVVDEEELEKRKKRRERFGLTSVVVTKP